jgi:hypothetical protein
MADSINDGGPAFPHPSGEFHSADTGMSLRDWFAGQALAGVDNPWASVPHELAMQSYRIADAMLAVRTPTEGG